MIKNQISQTPQMESIAFRIPLERPVKCPYNTKIFADFIATKRTKLNGTTDYWLDTINIWFNDNDILPFLDSEMVEYRSIPNDNDSIYTQGEKAMYMAFNQDLLNGNIQLLEFSKEQISKTITHGSDIYPIKINIQIQKMTVGKKSTYSYLVDHIQVYLNESWVDVSEFKSLSRIKEGDAIIEVVSDCFDEGCDLWPEQYFEVEKSIESCREYFEEGFKEKFKISENLQQAS